MRVRLYEISDATNWDDFVNQSPHSTFLHTRKFLSYHHDRFLDRSLIITDDDDKMLAVFSAALSRSHSHEIISHPGATYGGLIHHGKLRGNKMTEAIELICRFYRELGISRLIYKAVPSIYHRQPSEDDLWELHRRGAKILRRDLSTAIHLKQPSVMSERRRRSMKKSENSGLTLLSNDEALENGWPVIEQGLQDRHHQKPVHSFEEILELKSRFSEHIKVFAASIDSKVMACLIVFTSPRLWHSQYSVASPEGFKHSALDFLLMHAIGEARENGVEYFDFGISTEDNGRLLNEGLHDYKSEFGGGSFVYDQYLLEF